MLFSTAVFSGTWGKLKYAYVTTYSIVDYSEAREFHDVTKGSKTLEDLQRSHAHADNFATIMTKAKNKGSRVRRYTFKDSEVTEALMKGTESDNSEFVVFVGHGNKTSDEVYKNGMKGLGPITYDGGTLEPSEKAYGLDDTKWVFYDNCWSLNRPVADFWPAFKGLHAMFGYTSMMWQARVPYWPWSAHTTEQKWDTFSSKWVNEGYTMWDAYKEAIRKDIVMDLGASEEIKVISVKGTADGRSFDGALEKYNDVYNDQATGDARKYIGWRSTKYGSPTY